MEYVCYRKNTAWKSTSLINYLQYFFALNTTSFFVEIIINDYHTELNYDYTDAINVNLINKFIISLRFPSHILNRKWSKTSLVFIGYTYEVINVGLTRNIVRILVAFCSHVWALIGNDAFWNRVFIRGDRKVLMRCLCWS